MVGGGEPFAIADSAQEKLCALEVLHGLGEEVLAKKFGLPRIQSFDATVKVVEFNR